MKARNNLKAKVEAEEIKIILGWLWNFHQLLLFLLTKKIIAWSKDIRKMINKGTIHAKELGQNIGRFTHLGVVMPFVRHFMGHLQELHNHSKNQRSIKIHTDSEGDLHLMLHF